MSAKSKSSLSTLENKVMDVIWQHGSATADQVRSALEPRQPLKDSTIRTILRRLEEKGYVCHVTKRRTYVYSPTMAPQTVAADAVRILIDKFCNGSVEDLLVGLVDREVVSPQKLSQLAKRIADSRKAQANAKLQRRKGK